MHQFRANKDINENTTLNEISSRTASETENWEMFF